MSEYAASNAVLKCLFCDFTGSHAELIEHSSTCENHPLWKALVAEREKASAPAEQRGMPRGPGGDPNCYLCHGQGAFRLRHGVPPGDGAPLDDLKWHLDHCPICRPWAWGKT